MKKINVAIIGLRFGGAFPPIYLEHPDVGRVAICDANKNLLQSYGDKFGIDERFSHFEDVVASPDYDAVHVLTGIPAHADMTLAVLNAGKHCACTVPMATSNAHLRAIVAAQKATGKNYMMMETAVYTYQCLQAMEMVAAGEFGRIQFLRGAHYQDMEHWPEYWMGLPPMWYATHAVAPLLLLAGARATRVHCFGSGTMREELVSRYGNPYPVESAIFQLSREGLAAEVTRSLFETAHEYIESFHLYGEKKSFEWHVENELPMITDMTGAGDPTRPRLHKTTVEPISLRDYRERLPESIRRFTELHIIPDPNNPHQSIRQGGGHHGSHPHLVHEFVRSIVEDRQPMIDAVTAANWTAAGICAHESAMHDGAEIDIPSFN